MPYAITKSGGKYRVINKETGAVHAKGTTAEKAKAQIRLLMAKEHDPNFKQKGI